MCCYRWSIRVFIIFNLQFAVSQLIDMGIHGLAKLIADHAPVAIKEQDIKNYFGKFTPKNQLCCALLLYGLFLNVFFFISV